MRLAESRCPGFRDIEIESGLYEPQRFLLGRGSWSSGSARIKFGGPAVVGIKNPASSPLQQMKVEVTYLTGGQAKCTSLSLPRGQAEKP
ncbi:MAG: hypothetical protein U5N58_02095 [Actinomycetota bacterium]|nr:hypothetical protein [Actinomycetota bacterium]